MKWSCRQSQKLKLKLQLKLQFVVAIREALIIIFSFLSSTLTLSMPAYAFFEHSIKNPLISWPSVNVWLSKGALQVLCVSTITFLSCLIKSFLYLQIDEQKFELVVINPGYILGPVFHGSSCTSMEVCTIET